MRFRDLHSNIRIRIISSFLTRMVGTMVFPFMGVYFAVELGQLLAGILLFVTVLASILAGIYCGYIADRIGRKKVMVIAESIQLVSYAMMAFANSSWFTSAWLTFFMMLLQSAGAGLMNPAAEAMLIDVSTPEIRRFMYSINYWCINCSIAIGSILGGLLFESYRFELFVALAVVSLVTLFLLVFRVEETYSAKKKRETTQVHVWKDLLQNYRFVIKDQIFILYCLSSFLLLSLEFQTTNYVTVRLKHEFAKQTISFFGFFSYHLDGIKMASWIRTENTILVILGVVWLTRWLKRFSNTAAVTWGILLYTMGFFFLGYENHAIVLIIAVGVLTLGEIMHIPVKQSVLADIAKEEARSSYMAMKDMVFQGAKLAGALGITLGALVPSWLMAGLYLMIGLLALVIFRMVLFHLSGRETVDNRTTLSM